MQFEINIGLFIYEPDDTINHYAQVHARYHEISAELRQYDPGARIRFEVGEEPTLVAIIDVDDIDRLASHVCDTWNQDCIAVREPLSGQGHLLGPRAAQWGDFNHDLFVRY